jgi:heat shock protein
LIEERDFSSAMKRSEMEELCAPLFERVEKTLRQCLQSSGLKQEDISEVELIGGSTRMPAVKALIEQVFGKAPSTTLNQDECVARGAAIMAAMLSPNFKVREFALTDLQPYSIGLQWGGDAEQGELEVFPKYHSVPFSKILTFYRKGPFVLTARYTDPEVGHIQRDNLVGHFQVQGVKAGQQGEAQKVKVKVRLDSHGVFQVVSATLMEKQGIQASEEPQGDAVQADTEGMDTEGTTENQESTTPTEPAKMDTDNAEGQNGEKPTPQPSPPKQVVKSVDLKVEGKTFSIPSQLLHDLTERELGFQSVDHEERDRIDSKNALEEFVLSIRGRVNDSDDLEPYIESNVRDELVQLANNTENWLYDEGEDCKKNEYVAKMEQLQSLALPAHNRKRDHEGTPRAAELFAASLNRFQKALTAHRPGDPAYDHWTPEEATKLEAAINEKSAWLDSSVSRMRATQKTKDLPVKASAFTSEQQSFESSMNAVLNKPKPKPPAPPADAPKAEETPAPSGDKMDTD